MSQHYKSVNNGFGTELTIRKNSADSAYISIGKNGNDIMLRGNGKAIAFDTWNDLIDAIDVTKATYYTDDNTISDKGAE